MCTGLCAPSQGVPGAVHMLLWVRRGMKDVSHIHLMLRCLSASACCFTVASCNAVVVSNLFPPPLPGSSFLAISAMTTWTAAPRAFLLQSGAVQTGSDLAAPQLQEL